MRSLTLGKSGVSSPLQTPFLFCPVPALQAAAGEGRLLLAAVQLWVGLGMKRRHLSPRKTLC